MNVLDLFSGIGGFSLGLERAGMRTVAFCEIEPYCRAVLAKHWPGVPIMGDIRTVGAEQIAALEPIDVICGGFPCQDISVAGAGAGLAGARSGLWSEYSRLIGVVRPRWVIVENVAALLSRGLGTVLADLAAIGYDAEWHCIPAAHLGAPHRRDRIWIIAYPGECRHGQLLQSQRQPKSGPETDVGSNGEVRPMANSECSERREKRETRGESGAEFLSRGQESSVRTGGGRENVADAESRGFGTDGRPSRQGGYADICSSAVADPERRRLQAEREHTELAQTEGGARGKGNTSAGTSDRGGWWESEPNVGRVAHGVPSRVDRLRALGNAVVPQIPEIIGRAIMNYAPPQSAKHE